METQTSMCRAFASAAWALEMPVSDRHRQCLRLSGGEDERDGREKRLGKIHKCAEPLQPDYA